MRKLWSLVALFVSYSYIEEEDGEIVNLADSRVDCLRGCLATLSVLVVRISLLEYSKIHE